MAKRVPRRTITQLHQFLHKSLSSPFSPLTNVTMSTVSHSFAEAIIEAIQQPIVILDSQFTIIAANKAFFTTFKYSRKTIIHKRLTDFIHQAPAMQFVLKKLSLLATKKTKKGSFEFTNKFRTIGERTIVINAKCIEAGEYKTDFILLSIDDITQKKKIEQQKDDFVGYVTHELKNPIASAYAFLQILQSYHKKTNDKKTIFLLDKMAVQMNRLNELLNSFTNVYRAQTGKLQLTLTAFDLNKVAHEIAETFQYAGSSHTVLVTGKIKEVITGDEGKIREAITNLITNAIKYSPDADRVQIHLEEDSENCIVNVQDFGVGLSPIDQERVFERFYRVKNHMDKKTEGMGLGLYLTSAIINEHKGKLWLKSELGKGSTFSFSLPKTTVTSDTIHS